MAPFIHYSTISLLMHSLTLLSTLDYSEAKRLGERRVPAVALGDPKANDATFPETSCFDDKITGFLNKYKIPGAGVAVLKDGKIVYAQGYGDRDVPGIGDPQQVPRKVNQCTPFRIASISKPVTSLAILRMIQAGKLKLSDKVFGPGGILQHMTNNRPVKDERTFAVTVEQLLQHTGGWDIGVTSMDPMFAVKASDTGTSGPPQCKDIITYMLGQPLQHTPGTKFAYSNFGYCILGRVVEQVTGLGYEEAVRQFLLDPAGVSRTEMYLGSAQLKDIPETESEYYFPEGTLTKSLFPTETNLVPAQYGGGWNVEAMDSHGGWVASAPQLMQMLSAVSQPHCNGTITGQNDDTCIIFESSLSELTKKSAQYPANVQSWYGLGFQVNTNNHIWHTGSLDGTMSIMVRTSGSYAWVMTTNARVPDNGAAFSDMDNLMWEAHQCVGDKWPATFQTTCNVGIPAPANPQPPNAPSLVELVLTTDQFPEETSVILKDKKTDTSFWVDQRFTEWGKEYKLQQNIDPAGCYRFEIQDTAGDGICCGGGNGSFNLLYQGKSVFTGGEFSESASFEFGDGCVNQS